MSSDLRNDIVCDCVMCDALRFRLESAGHSYNRVPFDFLHVPLESHTRKSSLRFSLVFDAGE